MVAVRPNRPHCLPRVSSAHKVGSLGAERAPITYGVGAYMKVAYLPLKYSATAAISSGDILLAMACITALSLVRSR